MDNISLTRCQCRLVGCTVSRLCFYKVLYIFNVFYVRGFPGASLHPLYVINLKKHIQQQQTIKAAKQKFTSLDNYIEQKKFLVTRRMDVTRPWPWQRQGYVEGWWSEKVAII